MLLHRKSILLSKVVLYAIASKVAMLLHRKSILLSKVVLYAIAS